VPAERCVLDHRGQAQCAPNRDDAPDGAVSDAAVSDAALLDAALLDAALLDTAVPDATVIDGMLAADVGVFDSGPSQDVMQPDGSTADANSPSDAFMVDEAMDADYDAAQPDAAAAPTQTGGDDGGCSATGGEGGLGLLFALGLLLGLRRERD